MLLERKVLKKIPVLHYTKQPMRWLLLKMNRRQAFLRIVHEINLGTDLMVFHHRISARKHARGSPRAAWFILRKTALLYKKLEVIGTNVYRLLLKQHDSLNMMLNNEEVLSTKMHHAF